MPAAEPVARYLARLPARTIGVTRLALRLFEWLPFPWRFSRMSVQARSEYLAKMERSRLGPYRDLVLLAKILAMVGYARDARVREVVGYESRCAVREGTTVEPPGPLGDLRAPDEGEQCDVVIVGSGAGGAVAAATLAEAGLGVIVLEAGPHVDSARYPRDPLEALPLLYRSGGLTIAEGRPAIPVPVGRVVGGTTVINSGTCFRAPDEVLADWRDRVGVAWATELDGDYERAERFLHVKPVDVERMGRNGQLCMEGAERLGASGGPIARYAGDCVQCSSCPIGCPIDAKRAMHVSYLPRAVAAGARVRAGVEARRILFEGERAVGVECAVDDAAALGAAATNGGRGPRRRFAVRARAVICAGGALGTPELLLRSGIAHPQLGRHLHIHPAAWIGARYEEEVRGWEGVMQSCYVDQWRSRGLLLEATFTPLAFGAQWLPGVGAEHQRRILDFDRLASIGVHLSDSSGGRVRLARDGSLRMTYALTQHEAATLHYGIARAAEIHFAAGAVEVYPQVGPVQVLRRGELDQFEAIRLRPTDLRLEAFHPMGTARMGADPAESVTSADGSVNGRGGLFVADASLLPTSIGVNPMMTIIACADRVAHGVVRRLNGDGRPVAAVAAGGRHEAGQVRTT